MTGFVTKTNTLHIGKSDSIALLNMFIALRAELDDMRAKYAAVQAALTAGTAVGAAGYPAASTQLAAPKFNAV